MSIPYTDLARLQGDLALRPLSAQAIRCAHDLAYRGECSGRYSHALGELERFDLAIRYRLDDDVEHDVFRPTELLEWLLETDRMAELEAR